MRHFVLVFHIIVTLIMICVILFQKGEDSTGGSGSGTFGARGAKNPLTMLTSILATIFFINCLILAILTKNESSLKPTIQVNMPEKLGPTREKEEGSKEDKDLTSQIKPEDVRKDSLKNDKENTMHDRDSSYKKS